MFRTVNKTDNDARSKLEQFRQELVKNVYDLYALLRRREYEMYGDDPYQDMDVENNPRITFTELTYRCTLKINVLIDAVVSLYDQITLVKSGKISAASVSIPDRKQIEDTINSANEAVYEIRAGKTFQEIKKIYLAGAEEAAQLQFVNQARPRP